MNKELISFCIFLFIIPQIKSLSFKYPTAHCLTNKKIFVIHSLGIDICDSAYKTSKRILTFDTEISETYLAKISISKYSNGYFVVLIINKVYLFNESGDPVFESSELSYLNGEYYSLSSHKFEKDSDNVYSYYFLISYINPNDLLLNFYYYNLTETSLTIIANRVNIDDDIGSVGLACQFSEYDYIICMYRAYYNYNYKFAISL